MLLVEVAEADEESGDRGQESGIEAGEIRGTQSATRNRDATALTVVEVDLAGLDDPLVMRPSYRVVDTILCTTAR